MLAVGLDVRKEGNEVDLRDLVDLVPLRAATSHSGRCDYDQEQLRLHEGEDAKHTMMLYLIVRFDALQLEADIIIILLVNDASLFFYVERFRVQWLRL